MSRMRPLHSACVAFVLAFVALASSAVSAANIEVDPCMWTTIMPELKDMPAPAWVKPGVEIGYYFGSATVRGSYKTYSSDPNGNFVDPQGNTYSASDTPGGSAHGVAISTVVSVEGKTLSAFSVTSLHSPLGPLVPTLLSSTVAYSSVCEAWISPEGLKKLFNLNGGQTRVVRAPYKLADTTYQAVWITYRGERASQYYVFDEATGILLRSGSATEATPAAVTGPGSGGPSTLLTITTYLGTRQHPITWGAFKPPAFRALHYQGGMTTTIPGSPGFTLPVESAVTPARAGDGWTEVTMHVKVKNPSGFPPTESDIKSITGSYGLGFFIPPASLQTLRQGQVLDTDPYTKYTYTVMGQTRGPNGPIVVIREAGESFAADNGYDLQTGTFVFLNKEDRSLQPATTVTQLQLVGRE